MRTWVVRPLVLAAFAAVIACSDGPGEPRRPPPERDNRGVFPEVWSSNGYDGQTFEFKTNCSSDYATLNECFLWDVTRVIVVHPDGAGFSLRKDFNINSYSGEVTRWWVLYGPAGEGLPVRGDYRFLYFKNDEVALEQTVRYQPEVIGYPKRVTWTREGQGLHVTWDPPPNVKSDMWYKVLVFPEDGDLISQTFEWDADSATLRDIPLDEGDEAEINVAAYFRGGYAYSEYVPLKWGVEDP